MTHVVCKRSLPQRARMCFALHSPLLAAPDLSLYVEKTATQGYLWPTHTHTHNELQKIHEKKKKKRLKKTEENAIEKCSLCWLFSDFYQAPQFPSLLPNCAQNQRLKAVDVQLFHFSLFF